MPLSHTHTRTQRSKFKTSVPVTPSRPLHVDKKRPLRSAELHPTVVLLLVALHPRPQIAGELGRNLTRGSTPQRNRKRLPSWNTIVGLWPQAQNAAGLNPPRFENRKPNLPLLGNRQPRTIPTKNLPPRVVFLGGWCANCRNLRKRQNAHHSQFCTRDVDRQLCGGGEWIPLSDLLSSPK